MGLASWCYGAFLRCYWVYNTPLYRFESWTLWSDVVVGIVLGISTVFLFSSIVIFEEDEDEDNNDYDDYDHLVD